MTRGEDTSRARLRKGVGDGMCEARITVSSCAVQDGRAELGRPVVVGWL
jgi:hypothetical protein